MPISIEEFSAMVEAGNAAKLVRRLAEDSPPSLYTLEKFERDAEITKLWEAGVELNAIAQRVSVSYRTVLRVVKRKSN